jgi:hypothetical protein
MPLPVHHQQHEEPRSMILPFGRAVDEVPRLDGRALEPHAVFDAAVGTFESIQAYVHTTRTHCSVPMAAFTLRCDPIG